MITDEMLNYLKEVGDQGDWFEVRSNAIAAKLRAAEKLATYCAEKPTCDMGTDDLDDLVQAYENAGKEA